MESHFQIKRSEIDFFIALDKLRYENSDEAHKRKLEIMAKEREYKLHDDDREHQKKLEIAKIGEQKLESKK